MKVHRPPAVVNKSACATGGTLSSTGTPIVGTQTWFMGTGRRKESVARVFLRAGSGKFTVNGREVASYFPNHAWKHDATEPLKFTSLTEQVDVKVTAHRSEERRVGKECRSRWTPEHSKKKRQSE